MSNWYSTLNSAERRTLTACFVGWALDAMDVQIFPLVMPTLIAAWGLSTGEAGVLGTVALVMSAVGGWIAGVLADRIGRVRVLQLTILWFAFFTFISGFTNSFDQLLITRSLQGLGFGGEWAAGATLMAEVIRPELRGRAVGSVQSGWSVGYGTAVLLFAVVFWLLPPQQAWRAMFFIGLIPALVAWFILRNVHDSKAYTDVKAAPPRDDAGMTAIFKGPLLRVTAAASLLSAGALGGNYTILTWLPTFLQKVRHLSVLHSSGYLAVNIIGSFCGYMVSAHLSDALGRRVTFVIMAVCAAITIAIYTMAPIGPTATIVLGFFLGFFQSGIIGGMGAAFAELFPTHVRANGQGFSYNAGRGLGAFVPALVGAAAPALTLGFSIGCFAVASYVLVLIAVALLPETRGKEFTAYA